MFTDGLMKALIKHNYECECGYVMEYCSDGQTMRCTNTLCQTFGTYYKVPSVELEPVNSEVERNAVFHKLWTQCVGTEDYDKEAWKSVSKQLEALGLYV